MNYYEHHIGDFLKKTIHLTAVEDGIYRRLLDRYYTVEGPLPACVRECTRLARALTAAERAAVKAVLAEFFTLTARGHEQNRANEEVVRFQAKSAKAKESALSRWKREKGKRPANASPGGMPTQGEGLFDGSADGVLPNHQAPGTNTHLEDAVGGFAQSDEPDDAAEPPSFDGNNEDELHPHAIVQLATGWELPAEWGMDAEALGWQPGEVIREAEKFRQYWVAGNGQGRRRLVKGWRQCWSNWLAKAAKERR